MGALDEILQHHAVWRGGAPALGFGAEPSGFAALDAELPGGGWPRQGLTELLVDQSGIGELGILIPVLARLTRAGKHVVLVAPPYVPYAPAWAASAVDLANVLVVQSANRHDALWASEQALHSGSCHALSAWLDKARYAELQRLAVAAEASRAAAFLFRPLAAAAQSSPSCLRLALEAAGDELAVHVVKRRGPPLSQALRLPLKRPFHVLDRASLSRAGAESPRAARRLGVPVHA
jgi:cell division inhibitor SulA